MSVRRTDSVGVRAIACHAGWPPSVTGPERWSPRSVRDRSCAVELAQALQTVRHTRAKFPPITLATSVAVQPRSTSRRPTSGRRATGTG